ncbi:MAG: 3-phosphoserine/phosphohydroxythreonine transaminase [Pseudomonadales bacterium]|nr:3-phosphoserine/phosphohydroxythreonine transaminase [Pseudomonadales bacterium]NRA17302.1 3-phosphoserine/phosphohydroxythreonine transaminase [Oceanospirillaceae bacterium]
MMRKHNFSAGPAAIPGPVLERAQAELLDWNQRGLSIMEMSHRSKEFIGVAQKAESDLRTLLEIPDNYKVLFLQGGATSQFAMIPLNLAAAGQKTAYIETGMWSSKAIVEAKRYSNVQVVASSAARDYLSVPAQTEINLDAEMAYLHYASNETVGGLSFDYVPQTGSVPLVADMSSDILSKRIDVSQFGMIYAGAQKNIGPAGLTVVIIRQELLGKAQPIIPKMYDYHVHALADSMSNTPPTFAWYLSGLVFEWLLQQGGVEAIEKINRRKAAKLYQVIDGSGFYYNKIAVANRSIMNLPFNIVDSELDAKFLQQSTEAGLLNLKGHKAVGGMRASIYNAVSEKSVDALVDFMRDFESRYG